MRNFYRIQMCETKKVNKQTYQNQQSFHKTLHFLSKQRTTTTKSNKKIWIKLFARVRYNEERKLHTHIF